MSVIIKDLRVKYEDVSFTFKDHTFKKGTVSFITGKNGVGKTTLLKAIARLIDFTGEIKGSGTYVAQNPVIFTKSVYENIVYPIRIRNLDVKDYDEVINTYAKLFEIEGLLEKNAHNLSGGEKMKVTIIRSLIFSPDVVLLDEPTTHLDLESINELIKIIKLHKESIKFIVVSHNKSFMDEIMDDDYRLE